MLDNVTHRRIIAHLDNLDRLQREQRSLLASLRRNKRLQQLDIDQLRQLVEPPPTDSSASSSDTDPQDDNLWADPNSPNAHLGHLLETNSSDSDAASSSP